MKVWSIYSNHGHSSSDIKKEIMGRSTKNKQNQEEEGGKIVKWQLHAVHNGAKNQMKFFFSYFTKYFNYIAISI